MITAIRNGGEQRLVVRQGRRVIWQGTPEMLAEEWREQPWCESFRWGPEGGAITFAKGHGPVTVEAIMVGRWWNRVFVAVLIFGTITWLLHWAWAVSL